MAHPHPPITGAGWLRGGGRPALAYLAAALLLVCATAPAQAQRCFTQNGQTICCDNSGNCYNR